jgi:hypothetical protein
MRPNGGIAIYGRPTGPKSTWKIKKEANIRGQLKFIVKVSKGDKTSTQLTETDPPSWIGS